MIRSVQSARRHLARGDRWQESWQRLTVPLVIWICVSISLRYGYFGDTHMVLGPNASRLMKASSMFVRHVEAIDDDKKGILLYDFLEEPKLSLETNWSTWKFMILASYSHKGFSLWLNKGSKIRLRWEARQSILNQLQVVVVKGERKYETLLPDSVASLNCSELIDSKEAEYTIEEGDKYNVRVINTNAKSIIITMRLNITSKVHDLSKSTNVCSTINGSCKLNLQFPRSHYIVLTTPNNGELGEWYIELSFVARVVTYVAILGFIIVIMFLIFKYLGACDGDSGDVVEEASRQIREEYSETRPIIQDRPMPFDYGTNKRDEEDDGGSSSSSEDLYDSKLCVICYDDQRNCFFVPCGHCATCYDCAQRIMEGETKVCPICRRLIHKVRRLFTP